MWCNTVCLKCFKRRLSLRGVLLTQFPRRINDEVWKKKTRSTNSEYAYSGRLQISFHGGVRAHFFPLSLLTFINSKSYSRRMEVSENCVFCQMWSIWTEDSQNGVCVLPHSFFRSGVPVFKSPSLKWAHHKTNTVWQRAGSLCSYEAQNLMSMNNEYYSTCWWLSRVPVIRSMKALLSREHSLSRWIMDIRRSDIMERTFLLIFFSPQCGESADSDRHVAPHLTGNLFLISVVHGMSAVNSLNLITVVFWCGGRQN